MSTLNSFYAKSLGFDHPFLQDLMQNAREGHLCLQRLEKIDLPSSLIEEGTTLFPTAPIVKYGNLYYLQRNWVCETYVLEHVRRLRKQKAAWVYTERDSSIGFELRESSRGSSIASDLVLEIQGHLQSMNPEALPRSKPIPESRSVYNAEIFKEELTKETQLLPEQKEALQRAFDSPFSLICGGPGTGKTYTAGFLVRFLTASLDRSVKKQYRIVLAAPTGKAALHLQSSLLARGPLGDNIFCEASTLHRLLKLKPGETKLFHKKRIDADLIIVDEASMIDLSLFAHLLEAVGDETRLVLMGDPNQLPPIETGSLFAECADLFGFFLKRCMRIESSSLQISADAILQGDENAFFVNTPFSENFDEALLDRLYEKLPSCIFKEKPNEAICLREQAHFCILDALRQGPFGTEILNQKILEKIDRQCKSGQWWAIPILATANLPHLNLYNGARGILIGQKGNRLDLSCGAAYFVETGAQPLARLPPFEVSFILSIHKSQGSEFDEVVVLIPKGSENFGKEALYTAATRAKKQWELIGQKETLRQMLSQRSRKHSGFSIRFLHSSLPFADREPGRGLI